MVSRLEPVLSENRYRVSVKVVIMVKVILVIFVSGMCFQCHYINIIKINNYLNGEVQTILNDTSINNEVLTVSQKIVIDDSGDIDFEPNISINVVQSE